jgi:two-component system, LytTR family, sensor histidine kinase AlgZ
LEERRKGEVSGGAPVSVHFVNNVLAAAASYIEDDPELARDVLADLGSFLSHRLRGPRTVPVADELDHVAVYLRLEQARFPGRIVAELPAVRELPAQRVEPGDVQAPLAEAVGRWLTRDPGRVRLALRVGSDVVALQLDRPDAPGQPGERVRIPLGLEATGSAA